jgi:hypothetical protein
MTEEVAKEVEETMETTPIETDTPAVNENNELPAEDAVSTEGDTEEVETKKETVPDSIPQGSEQARAFQEQRLKIKQLETELEQRKQSEANLSRVTTPTANEALNNQQQLDLFKARIKYPQLDPDSSSYDHALDERIAEKWVFSKVTGLGKTISQIAKDVIEGDRGTKKAVKEAETRTAQAVKESITLKEQVSATAPTKSAGARTTSADVETLRGRTRKGDQVAFLERLRKIEGK